MRMTVLKLLSVLFLSVWVVGCGYTASGAQVGTAVGAGAGALAGYAIAPRSPAGAIIGAGAGALIGHSIGRSNDEAMYMRRYYSGH